MSWKKQIDEIFMIIDDVACGDIPEDECDAKDSCSYCRAERLYNAGYRKQSEGEWEKHIDEYDCEYTKCSSCGEEFYDASGEDTIDMFYNFCPNCGAKMKGV